MTNKELERTIERAASDVLDMCLPEKMSPEEAIEFMERVIGTLEGSIEALKEENDL